MNSTGTPLTVLLSAITQSIDDERERWEKLGTDLYCATCGERNGSVYAGHCCTDDNMIDQSESEG